MFFLPSLLVGRVHYSPNIMWVFFVDIVMFLLGLFTQTCQFSLGLESICDVYNDRNEEEAERHPSLKLLMYSWKGEKNP